MLLSFVSPTLFCLRMNAVVANEIQIPLSRLPAPFYFILWLRLWLRF